MRRVALAALMSLELSTMSAVVAGAAPHGKGAPPMYTALLVEHNLKDAQQLLQKSRKSLAVIDSGGNGLLFVACRMQQQREALWLIKKKAPYTLGHDGNSAPLLVAAANGLARGRSKLTLLKKKHCPFVPAHSHA